MRPAPETPPESPDCKEIREGRMLPLLRANGPYDFHRSFSRIVCAVVATRHPEMGKRALSLDGGEFALALRLRGRPLLIGLRAEATDSIKPRVLEGRVERGEREALLAEIRRILCLDHDLKAFYETVKGDHPLERLTHRYLGLRLTLTPTPFQGLVHAILFQQISYAAAQTVENRLIARWGEPVYHGDRSFSLFPTPEKLALQPLDTLRSLGIPPRKGLAILEAAGEIASGKLDLDALAAQSDAELVARRLQAIRGIGPWTAHHVIIRGMGMVDCLPREDPGLRRAVSTQYAWDTVSTRQLAALAERWRPWRSYAAYYLWNTFWE